MKNVWSKIIPALSVVFCVMFSLFAINANAAEIDYAKPIDSCETVMEAYTVKQAKRYISGENTYPNRKGYVFAGWYSTNDSEIFKDDKKAAEYVIETTIPEGQQQVYALFVPEHVLSIKAQISTTMLDDQINNDSTAAIRFVTTVNSLLYKQVGFEITYIGRDGNLKTSTSASNKVYQKLYVAGTTEEWEVTPQGTFCGASKYFKACTVKNVPVDNYSTEFTVKPYWITFSGDKVYGVEGTKTVEEGCLREDVYVTSAVDAEGNPVGQDIPYYGSYEYPYATLDYAIAHVEDGKTVHVKDSLAVVASTENSNIAQWTAHGKKVTITGNDKVEGMETLDLSATNTVLIKDSVTFSDITLKLMDVDKGTKQTIFAEGNDLTIHSDVVFSNASAVMNNEFNLTLVGGSSTKSVESTNLKLYGGTYTAIYGGGTGQNVLGDTNVTVGEKVNANIDYTKHNYYHMLYGGCYSGTVYGDTNIIVEDGAKFNYIFGGGEAKASKIVGTTNIQFEGQSMAIYGGSREGTNSDTHILMIDGKVQQIFGGCESNSMTGNTDIRVLGGTVDRRIYGGCYNYSSNSEDYQVIGHTNVLIGPSATISLASSGANYSGDAALAAVSRRGAFDNEWGALIFNENSPYLESMTGWDTSPYYHYRVKTNGNTTDDLYGGVLPAGDCLHIIPKENYVATVTIDGVVKNYSEGECYYPLPELSSKTSQTDIVVTFGTGDKTEAQETFTNSAEAKIGTAYYETLEQAIAVAEKLENATIENLSETKGLATISVAEVENGTVTSSCKNCIAGETVTLTVTPDTGYDLKKLSVKKDGTEVALKETVTFAGGTYSFVTDEGNYSVEAEFAKPLFTGSKTDDCWDFTKQYENVIELNSTCTNTNHYTYVGESIAYTDVDFAVKVKDGTNDSVTTKTVFKLKFNDDNNEKAKGRVDLSIQSEGNDVFIYLACADTKGNTSVVYTLTEAEAQKYKSDGIEMRVVRKGLKLAVYLDGNQCELTNDTDSLCQDGVITLTSTQYITETMKTSLVLHHYHDAGAQVEFPYKLKTSVEEVTIKVLDSENGTLVPENSFYVVGDTISLKGQADSDYYCYGYNVDGEFVEADKNGTYSFEAIENIYEVEALFAKNLFTGWKTDSCWDFTKQYKNIMVLNVLNNICTGEKNHGTYIGSKSSYDDVDYTVKVKEATYGTTKSSASIQFKYNDTGSVKFLLATSGEKVQISVRTVNDTADKDSVVYTLSAEEAAKYQSEGVDWRIVKVGMKYYVFVDGKQCLLSNSTYPDLIQNNAIVLKEKGVFLSTNKVTLAFVYYHPQDAEMTIEFPYKLNTDVQPVTITDKGSTNGTLKTEKQFYLIGETIKLSGAPKSGYYCYGFNVDGEFIEANKSGSYSFETTKGSYEVEALFAKNLFTDSKTDDCWDFTKQYENIIELNSTCTNTNHYTYVGESIAYTDVDFAVKVKDGTNNSGTTKTVFKLKFDDNNNEKEKGRVDLSIQSNGNEVSIYLACADTKGNPSVVYTLTKAEAQKYKSDGIEMRMVRKGLKLAVYLDGNQCELTNDTDSLCQDGVITLTSTQYITETMKTSLVLHHYHDAGAQVEFPYKLKTSVEQVAIEVTDSENGTLVPENSFYVVGDTVVLRGEGSEGYYCKEMKVDGKAVEMNWDGTYSFVAKTEKYTVEGSFAKRVFKDSANVDTQWNVLEQNQGSVVLTNGRTGTKGVVSAFTDTATAGGKCTALEFYDSYTDMDLTLNVKNDPNTSSGETPRTAVEFAFANGQKLGVSVTEISGDVYIQTMGGDLINWKRIYKFTDEQEAKYRSAEGVEWRVVRKGTQFFFSIDGVVCEQGSEASGTNWYIADIVDLTAISSNTVTAETEATVKFLHYGDAGQWIEMPFTVTGTVNTLITTGWITHDSHKTQTCWDYSKQYIDMISLTTCGDTKTMSHGLYMGTASKYADVDFSVKVKAVEIDDKICEPSIDIKYNNGNWKDGRVAFYIKSDGDDVYITMKTSQKGFSTSDTEERVYTFTKEEAAKYRASGINWRVIRQGLKLAVYIDDNKCNLSNDKYAAYFQDGIVVLKENGNFTADNKVSLALNLNHHSATAKLTVDFPYKLYESVDEELLGTTSLNTELLYINKKTRVYC